jgi:hypothetical protein
MERCQTCNRQFGLVRHRWWGYQFCTKKCLNDFLVKRIQEIERLKGWLGIPDREPSRLPVMSGLNRARRVGEKSMFPKV